MQKIIDNKNKLQIIMVEPLGDGGIAHYTYNLLNALTTKGAKATLFTNKNYELENNQLTFIVKNKMFKMANWLIHKYPVLNSESGPLSIIRRLMKLIEYPLNMIEILFFAILNNIKIIHLQSVNLIELLMIIAFRIFNKKIVFTIHNVMPKHKKLRFYHIIFFRIMYALCHEIIIHTGTSQKEIISLFKVERKKIHVIPHGDYKFFVPDKIIPEEQAKIKLGIYPETKTILFFGAVRENKGLENILYALPVIKQQVKHIKLLIVGEPWENYDKYRKIINKLKITDYVYEKLDYVPNDQVSLYFFASDLIVFPYNEISQSGVLQIAYAFGKPIVAADLGGFREAVVEGKNGYLSKVKDKHDFSAKCISILNDDITIKKMGNYSKNLSDTVFSWPSIAVKTLKVYNLCLTE